jgi:hypothetical protein
MSFSVSSHQLSIITPGGFLSEQLTVISYHDRRLFIGVAAEVVLLSTYEFLLENSPLITVN